jgi:predicted DNA-binding protein
LPAPRHDKEDPISKPIKLNSELYDRVKRCSDAAGYSSPQEFVEHVLEKELAKLEDAQSDEEIVSKLKGLGYLE